MRLFYSGLNAPNLEQTTPTNSLGGYISSNPIQSNNIQSIFDESSVNRCDSKIVETKCFFIKNILNADVENIMFYELTPDVRNYKFKIGAVKSSNVELLQSQYEKPFNIIFTEAEVVYPFCDILNISNLTYGEIITIEGVDIVVPDGKISTFVKNSMEAFSENENYKISALKNGLFRLKKVTIDTYTQPLSYNSVNGAVLTSSGFDGCVDNSVILIDELKAGECLAIFIQKIPNSQSVVKDNDYYRNKLKEFKDNNFEQISVESENSTFVFDFTIKTV